MAPKKPLTFPRLHAAVVSLETATGKLQTLSELRAWRIKTAHRLGRVSVTTTPAVKGPRK